MFGKLFITAWIIIVGFLLPTRTATTFGQETKYPIQRNDSKSSGKTRPLKMSPQPTFTISELDDEKMRVLTGRQGGRAHPLLLYLWYTDCQPCRTYFSDVERISREYQGRGLDVVTVFTFTQSFLLSFLKSPLFTVLP